MLFATLDPTMRGVDLPSGRKIIASDTVGFISDLPTQLVAAFRATLEEVLEADLILHVRDITHPETAEQAADVADILASLGVKPDIADVRGVEQAGPGRPGPERDALTVQAQTRPHTFPISALTGEGIAALSDAISQAFEELPNSTTTLTLTFAQGRQHAWLHGEGVVDQETQTDDGWTLQVTWTERQKAASPPCSVSFRSNTPRGRRLCTSQSCLGGVKPPIRRVTPQPAWAAYRIAVHPFPANAEGVVRMAAVMETPAVASSRRRRVVARVNVGHQVIHRMVWQRHGPSRPRIASKANPLPQWSGCKMYPTSGRSPPPALPMTRP